TDPENREQQLIEGQESSRPLYPMREQAYSPSSKLKPRILAPLPGCAMDTTLGDAKARSSGRST
ncbi:hypothetical protein PENTCL1PPCAC_27166, partial [Pristionchus entomophagus]